MIKVIVVFVVGCHLSQVGSAWTVMDHPVRNNLVSRNHYRPVVIGISPWRRLLGTSSDDDDDVGTTTIPLSDELKELKRHVETDVLVPSLSRGLNVKSDEERQSIDDWISQMESLCPLKEPARNERMGGRWIVDYTTAPPPSNGKLGPFIGVARQEIDLDSRTYVNYLSVPGDDLSKEWLSAKLVANYQEWDGQPLPDDRLTHNDPQPQTTTNNNDIDHGATSWKVNFEKLTIRLFGIPLITQNLSGKSRIWKMSYLDDKTRIVRAGRTGLDKDDMVFYMSRDSS